MTKRIGGALAPSDEHEPQPAQPEQRYVVEDALWVVPSSNYVDPSPPLETSIFDDPNRLGNAWLLTVSTLKAEARESKEKKRQIEEKARALIEEADRAVVPPNDHQADRSTEVSQPITKAKGEGPDGLFDRLDRLAQAATKRLTLRHG